MTAAGHGSLCCSSDLGWASSAKRFVNACIRQGLLLLCPRSGSMCMQVRYSEMYLRTLFCSSCQVQAGILTALLRGFPSWLCREGVQVL